MNDYSPSSITRQTAHSLIKCSIGATVCSYNQQIAVFTSGLTPNLLANFEIDKIVTKVHKFYIILTILD